jgi:ATP-dependent helicase/nuclease subunit A
VRANRKKPRTIFAVGDEKQSIFSFQGADPEAFEINRDYFEKIVTDVGLQFENVPLTESRRSVPQVLEFVDSVFETPAARTGLTLKGEEVKHTAHRAEHRGRVEFLPALKPGEREDRTAWRRLIDAHAPDSPVVRLAKQLADRVAAWLDGKHKLPSRDRPVRAGDIMILLWRRAPFAAEIIRQLKARGVPVAGADRITLTEQISVMDLMALGRFVLLPEDDLNLAALLRSPLGGFSDDDLETLCVGRSGGVWSELVRRKDEAGVFGAAHGLLSDMLSKADFMPPYEFYARVLDALGFRAKMLARLGPEAADAMDEFLSLALTYEAENTPSLEGFLRWMERGETEIRRDMESTRNEVRVLTGHGAKGLEADIVIVPDTVAMPGARSEGKLLYTKDGILFPMPDPVAPDAVRVAKDHAKAKRQEEHRRLMYVVLTRPRDHLYFAGFETRTAPNPESWYELARAAAEKIGQKNEASGAHVYGESDFEPFVESAVLAQSSRTLPGWMTATPSPEKARPRYIRPSDAAGLEEPAVSSPLNDGAKRFRRGLLVHSMLAHLPELDAGERDTVAHQFLKARGIEKVEADALVKETLAVLNDPQFAHAFTKDSRAEVAIVANVPELGEDARTSGRIDRLAVTDGEVLVVDFKTNRPPPERVEDVPPFYVTQMALYRAALEKVFPGRHVSCALVWTEGPSLMALPDSTLDAEVGRIKAKLSAAP